MVGPSASQQVLLPETEKNALLPADTNQAFGIMTRIKIHCFWQNGNNEVHAVAQESCSVEAPLSKKTIVAVFSAAVFANLAYSAKLAKTVRRAVCIYHHRSASVHHIIIFFDLQRSR